MDPKLAALIREVWGGENSVITQDSLVQLAQAAFQAGRDSAKAPEPKEQAAAAAGGSR